MQGSKIPAWNSHSTSLAPIMGNNLRGPPQPTETSRARQGDVFYPETSHCEDKTQKIYPLPDPKHSGDKGLTNPYNKRLHGSSMLVPIYMTGVQWRLQHNLMPTKFPPNRRGTGNCTNYFEFSTQGPTRGKHKTVDHCNQGCKTKS